MKFTKYRLDFLSRLHNYLQWRKRTMCAVIVASLSPVFAYANPDGAQIISGQVSVDQSVAGITTVTNSPNAIINWQNFNIAQNEITRFVQQNGQSAVLNRIIGGNPSEILGSLFSNGKVFLINPNGIVFGAGAQIDTQGFLASTLNMSNSDFQRGNFHFVAGSKAGDITNEGIIHAGKDGNIVLIAPNIENKGIIHSEGGKIVLAAGQELVLTSLDDPEIRFQVQSPKNRVLNIGQLLTEGGAINVFAGTLKHSGDISADSVEVDKQGNIRLVAKGEVTLEKDSKTTANNEKGDAGKIEITGEKVAVLDNSKIEAVGKTGGGEVLIGGDYQGKNPAVQNAQTVTVAEKVEIKADAVEKGDGGKIVVWSDNETKVAASFSAKGGKKSGDGGLVETSGKQLKIADTTKVSTKAAKGKTGTWLLDPLNFTIAAGSDAQTNANIGADTLSTNLGGGNITIATDTTTGAEGGDIIVNALVSWAENKLTLHAFRNIDINATLDGSGTAQLALEYGQGALASGNTATYNVYAPVNLSAGQNFSTKLGSNGTPVNYTVINSVGVAGDTTSTTLQGMKNALSGNYALGGNVDASGTASWNSGEGFEPVGYDYYDYYDFYDGPYPLPGSFTGKFDGLGHTIDSLKINRPTSHVGLFGYSGSGSEIKNVGVTNVNISGYSHVGGLLGYNDSGTVSNSYSTGSVSGSYDVGGLVGSSYGTVSNSYYNVDSVLINGVHTLTPYGIYDSQYQTWQINNFVALNPIDYLGAAVGGYYQIDSHDDLKNMLAFTGDATKKFQLAANLDLSTMPTGWYIPVLKGEFDGTNYVLNNFTFNRPTQSSAGLVGQLNGGTLKNIGVTNVSISGYTGVGGLIGYNVGTVSNSYSTGSVSGSSFVGGLMGSNWGTVSNSYSTGSVSGTNYVGGLVGSSYGTVSNSFWNTLSSGRSTSASGTGLTTEQMQDRTNFTNWDFANTWTITNGSSYPHLLWQGLDQQLISGTAPANKTLDYAVNGVMRGSVTTDGSGNFSVNSWVGTGNLLVWLSGETDKAATLTNDSYLTALKLELNTVYGQKDLDTAALETAKGSISDSDIPFSFSGLTLTPAVATLKANNDVIIHHAIATSGAAVSIKAGKSVEINSDGAISTNGGNIEIVANADTATDGINNAHRDAGQAFIEMAAGSNLNAGLGVGGVAILMRRPEDTWGITLDGAEIIGGDISISGVASADYDGILINDSILNASSITLSGTGALGTTGSVYSSNGIAIFGSTLDASNAIILSGTTKDYANANNVGVYIDTALLKTTSGTITISGTVSEDAITTGALSNTGVDVWDSTLESGGSMVITGSAQGDSVTTSSINHGVSFSVFSSTANQILSSGVMNITGTAGGSSSTNYGIGADSTEFFSDAGEMTFNGTGTTAGINFDHSTLIGSAYFMLPNESFALETQTGNINLVTDKLTTSNTGTSKPNAVIATTGAAVVNSTGSATLPAITANTVNAFSTGVLTANSITTSGTGNNVLLKSNEDIILPASNTITTQGGVVTLNSDADATNGGTISFNGTTGSTVSIITNGGNIIMGGGNCDATNCNAPAIGAISNGIGLDYANLNAGTGKLNLQGTTTSNSGVSGFNIKNSSLFGKDIYLTGAAGTTSGWASIVFRNSTVGNSSTDNILIKSTNQAPIDFNQTNPLTLTTSSAGTLTFSYAGATDISNAFIFRENATQANLSGGAIRFLGTGNFTLNAANAYNFNSVAADVVGSVNYKDTDSLAIDAITSFDGVASTTTTGFKTTLDSTLTATTVTNNSVITIGGTNLAKTLNIAGNYTQTPTGVLNVELGGTAANQFDKLAVTGDVALAGTLNASLINSFSPSAGNTFSIISRGANNATGTFSTFDTPLNFQVGYNLAANEAVKLSYVLGGTNYFTNAANDLSWHNAGNWSRLGIPTSNDDVQINNGTGYNVTYSTGSSTIKSLNVALNNALNITGGVLTVTNATVIDGGLNLTNAATFTPNATTGISGTGIISYSVSNALTLPLIATKQLNATAPSITANSITTSGTDNSIWLESTAGSVNLNAGEMLTATNGTITLKTSNTMRLGDYASPTGSYFSNATLQNITASTVNFVSSGEIFTNNVSATASAGMDSVFLDSRNNGLIFDLQKSTFKRLTTHSTWIGVYGDVETTVGDLILKNAMYGGTYDDDFHFSGSAGTRSLISGGNLQIGNEANVIKNDAGVNPILSAKEGVLFKITSGYGYFSGNWNVTADSDLNGTGIIQTAAGAVIGGNQVNLSGKAIDLGAGITSAGGISLTADNLTLGANTLASSGNSLTIKPQTANTTIGIAGGAGTLQIPATYFSTNLANGFSNITIGSSTAGQITVGDGSGVSTGFTALDSITLQGSGIAIDDAINATGQTLTLNSTGNVTQTAPIIATNLLLLGAGNYQLDYYDIANQIGNQITNLAASGIGNLNFMNSTAFTIDSIGSVNGVNATGTVDIASYNGDLTVNQPVLTTNTTANALKLNAGYIETTTTTANIIVGSNGSFSVGTGGIGKFFTGSISGSTGLATLIGLGSGRFRYNSDESTANYTTALLPYDVNNSTTTGLYAIYREIPYVSFTVPATYSTTYNAQPILLPLTLNNAQFPNGDGTLITPEIAQTAEAMPSLGIEVNSVSAGFPTNAGEYSVTVTPISTGDFFGGLGYSINTTALNSSVTINPAPLSITANALSKTYGAADPTLTYTESGLISGDTLTGSLIRAIGEEVGIYPINQGSLSAGTNYTINYISANLTINSPTSGGEEIVIPNDPPPITPPQPTPEEIAAQLEAERLVVEAAAKAEAERLVAEAAAKAEAERLVAEAAAKAEAERLAAKAEAERLAAEAAAKAEAERLAAEAAAKAEAERLAAKAEAERLAAEAAAERLAAEAAAKAEAERLAAEAAAKAEAERLAAEAAAKAEAERLAAEAAAKAEAERLAAEAAAKAEAERLAAEAAAKAEAERLAAEATAKAEAAAKAEAERLAAEAAAKVEAERLAAEAAAKAEAERLAAERLAAEAAAKAEAERLAAEAAAKAEAERLAAEAAAKAEAERLAAEAAAKAEAERLAAEAAAKAEAERLAAEVAAKAEAERLAAEAAAKAEAERLAAEVAAKAEAERLAAEAAAKAEAERLAAEAAAKAEAERLAAEAAAKAEAERLAAEAAAKAEAERLAAEAAAKAEAERLAAEAAAKAEAERLAAEIKPITTTGSTGINTETLVKNLGEALKDVPPEQVKQVVEKVEENVGNQTTTVLTMSAQQIAEPTSNSTPAPINSSAEKASTTDSTTSAKSEKQDKDDKKEDKKDKKADIVIAATGTDSKATKPLQQCK